MIPLLKFKENITTKYNMSIKNTIESNMKEMRVKMNNS